MLSSVQVNRSDTYLSQTQRDGLESPTDSADRFESPAGSQKGSSYLQVTRFGLSHPPVRFEPLAGRFFSSRLKAGWFVTSRPHTSSGQFEQADRFEPAFGRFGLSHLQVGRFVSSHRKQASSFRAARRPVQLGGLTHCILNLPFHAQIQAIAMEVQNLLVSGKKMEALECAQFYSDSRWHSNN